MARGLSTAAWTCRRARICLDVACGSGQLALIAAREGARVTGVDIAENLIERAQARSMVEGLQTRFQVADAESLPFPDASFDVVVSLMGAMFAPRPHMVAGSSCASVFPAEPSQWRIGPGRVCGQDVQDNRQVHCAFGDGFTSVVGR